MNKIIYFNYFGYIHSEERLFSNYWENRNATMKTLMDDYNLQFVGYDNTHPISINIIILRPLDDSLFNLLLLKHSNYIIKMSNYLK